ncbi:MAG: pyruvate kinase [Elusimicrobiota bacterium]
MRRTKIIATLGPASMGRIGALLRAGADVLRFNLSHGDPVEHARAMLEAGPAARLADLCGPKIRTGPAPEGGVRLTAGSLVTLAPGDAPTTPERVSVSYSRLAKEARPGQRVLLADGRMELGVEGRKGDGLLARVRVGGILESRKGVNLPGADLSVPAMTEKDERDLAAVARAKPEYVALSFVRSAEDLIRCRHAMDRRGLRSSSLIAKIETPEAVSRIETILEACDGIMVARGDLGVEMPQEELPAIQRRLVELADRKDRLCIVATEMLESMVQNPRPTRAEVSDVAAAVRDGTDAVMLSAETSVGRYPVGAVKAMSRILAAAEQSLLSAGELSSEASLTAGGGAGDLLALAAHAVSDGLPRACLAVATETGRSALFVSKSRPGCPILALSPSPGVVARMALYWGVRPVLCRAHRSHLALLREAETAAKRVLGARKGDPLVVLSGTPLGRSGNLNTLQIRRI